MIGKGRSVCRLKGGWHKVYVMVIPKENKWSGFLNSLNLFSEDFMSDGRRDNIPQEREQL